MKGSRVNKVKLGTLAKASLLILAIALLDWAIDLNLSFGFLYIFPILLLGTVFSAPQIVAAALLCTVLADWLDPFPFSLAILPQDLLVFVALLGSGLLSVQVTKRRREEADSLRRLEQEASARREAEEQLEFLIDSSPAAVFIMDSTGGILLANPAAHRLLATGAQQLPGRNIHRYIPALSRVTSTENNLQPFRTEMQCRGEKETGDIFLANVFFSTYNTRTGPRLAALVVDASEELRDREESSLQQMLAGSRILAAAVSHEVRNVCAAMAVIHQNLLRGKLLSGNKDFESLGSLIETLTAIASLELRNTSRNLEIAAVDLHTTLYDLRIVLEAYCDDAGIALHWDIPDSTPLVVADRHSLLQVLLNLTKNSERALRSAPVKAITFSVTWSETTVSLRVTDTGPGIKSLEKLFQPFQKGADSNGLGLYISRAFLRSFQGDLRHDPASPGCAFVIDLLRADARGHLPAESREHSGHPVAAK